MVNAATAVNPSFSPDATPVILLGASNLARGFPSVMSALRQGLEGPLHMAVAMGHGRSFGIRSYLFGRTLPGILECGLWPHLRSSCGKIRTPLAAIADLGNDLMYGVDVETLLGWLELSLIRLRELNATVVMLSLPMASLDRLKPLRFAVARRLLFPSHRGTWPELQGKLARLDAGMRELSRRQAIAWVEAPAHWYGVDPIHIRRRYQPEAWQALFSRWPGWRASIHPVTRPGFLSSLALRQLRPAERELFGYRQLTAQPVVNQPDHQIFLF